MSATPPIVPLWAEHYIPDFRALQQILERSPHFFLQPVETPSPDLARIFADWLRAAGWTVRLVELRETESWAKLAEVLQEDTSSDHGGANRAVVVSAPHDLDVEILHMSMARINMQRDTIARTMDCPLLWFGTRSFQQSTWEHAPDFWSIASVPYRIPLRDLADAQRHMPMAMAWWTGAANDDLPTLEASFSRTIADGSDPGEAARIGLRLAECQFFRGDLVAAQSAMATVHPWLHGDIEPRWRLLHQAIQDATAAGPRGIIEQLRGRILEAQDRGAQRMEALLRFGLADYLRCLPETGMEGQARDELCKARALLADVGDHLAVLYVDEKLASFGGPPAPELILAMVESTEALLRASEDPVVCQHAALVLIKLYQRQQRIQDATRMLDMVLSEQSGLRDDFGRYGDALQQRATLAMSSGDWLLAFELETQLIATVERAQIPTLECLARSLRALACRALGKQLHACVDLLAAARLASMEGDYWAAGGSFNTASSLALGLGVPRVAAVLLLRAVQALLHDLSRGPRDVPKFDVSWLRGAGETELEEHLNDLNRGIADVRPTLPEAEVQQRLVELRQEFQQLLDIRETELRSQGIDVMDPLTWGISEEPPATPQPR